MVRRSARILMGAAVMWLFLSGTLAGYDHIISRTENDGLAKFFELCKIFPYMFAAFVMGIMTFGKMPERIKQQ